MQGEEDHLLGTYGVPVPHAVSPRPPYIGTGPKLEACALAPRDGGGGHPQPPS